LLEGDSNRDRTTKGENPVSSRRHRPRPLEGSCVKKKGHGRGLKLDPPIRPLQPKTYLWGEALGGGTLSYRRDKKSKRIQ